MPPQRLDHLNLLPQELMSFQLLKVAAARDGARLGRLCVSGRSSIDTPHYLGVSSRGAVPHLSQDIMRGDSSIKGIYVGLEDYLERLPLLPPVYSHPFPPAEGPLRRFIALQKDALLVLGPRRFPPILTPAPNSYTAMSILTSVGFRSLEVSDYIKIACKLRPDITIGCADVVYGLARTNLGVKRKEKMGERTLAWIKALWATLEEEQANSEEEIAAVWAPILPIEGEMQKEYLEFLEEEETRRKLEGMVLYDVGSIDTIPARLQQLPRLALTEPAGPQRLLHEIGLGVDLVCIPFLSTATDSGIDLNFKFPAPESGKQDRTALGLDMWSTLHATDLSPLDPCCSCYTCTHHHRAFVHHLLTAKEMLGWVLLQVHNHAVADALFDGIRKSISNGRFGVDVDRFVAFYEADLPVVTGTGPRIRGYQFQPSGPSLEKKNPSAYRKLATGEQINPHNAKKVAENSHVLVKGSLNEDIQI
ncbi:hypothetical protein MMC13_004418 [Lambiella insularis]|nr:hypothetical protein [Lambiella insularis]